MRRCRGRDHRERGARRSRRRGGRCFHFEPGQRRVQLALVQAIEHEGEAIEIGIERIEKLGRRPGEDIAGEQPALHPVRELAQAHRAGHARAALEGVQRPPQRLRRVVVGRIALPRAKLLAGLREELRRFFEKDRQHLLVDIVENIGQRLVGGLRRRRRGRRPGRGLDFGSAFDLRYLRRRRRARARRLARGGERNNRRVGRDGCKGGRMRLRRRCG